MKYTIDELKEELKIILTEKEPDEWERLAGIVLKEIKHNYSNHYHITLFSNGLTMSEAERLISYEH